MSSKNGIFEDILNCYIDKHTSEAKQKAADLSRSNDKFLSLAAKFRFQIERILKEAGLEEHFKNIHGQRLSDLGKLDSDHEMKRYDEFLSSAGESIIKYLGRCKE